jgi:hypothetical protein
VPTPGSTGSAVGHGVAASDNQRLQFEFRVTSTGTRMGGRLALEWSHSDFSSTSVASFGRFERTATWAGAGEWNDHAGYTFTAMAIDGGTRSSGDEEHRSRTAADRLEVTIRDATGTTVLAFAGRVTTGYVVVSQASGETDRDSGDFHRSSSLRVTCR